MMGRVRGLFGVSFMRAIIPLMKAEP